MDYFKQRRAYRNFKLYEADVSIGQNGLYRELLDYANDEGKLDDEFPVKNSALMNLTGLSEAGIRKARNELSQVGLIKYIKGRKNVRAPRYKIINLYASNSTGNGTTGPKSTPTGTQRVTQTVRLPVRQTVPHKELTNTNDDRTNTNKTKRQHSQQVMQYGPSDRPYQLAKHLLAAIRSNTPDFRPKFSEKDLQRWANDFRLANEQDGRDYGKLDRMIDWCQQDTFWQANILSAATLRKKYDRLAAKANQEAKGARHGERRIHETVPPEWNKPADGKPLSPEQKEVLEKRIQKFKSRHTTPDDASGKGGQP